MRPVFPATARGHLARWFQTDSNQADMDSTKTEPGEFGLLSSLR